MTIKTATFNFLAAALVVGSCAAAVDSASAFGVVSKSDLVGKNDLVGKKHLAGQIELTSKYIVVTKTQQAPQGYHLQGFRGWDHGYPISFQDCSPLRAALPGACISNLPVKQGI